MLAKSRLPAANCAIRIALKADLPTSRYPSSGSVGMPSVGLTTRDTSVTVLPRASNHVSRLPGACALSKRIRLIAIPYVVRMELSNKAATLARGRRPIKAITDPTPVARSSAAKIGGRFPTWRTRGSPLTRPPPRRPREYDFQMPPPSSPRMELNKSGPRGADRPIVADDPASR
jgi:hypothetical protein